jgi:hypothetical protein
VTQKNDIPYKIIKTEKGYLIAGSYTMPPDKTSRAFWASVDDAGNLIKYNIVEPNKYSEFRGLLETPDKEYILAGLIRPENAKPYHSYLCKINSAGALIWQRVFTNAASSWANSVITAADGGYALAGGIGTTGNAYSVYVIKTDVNGEIKPAQK